MKTDPFFFCTAFLPQIGHCRSKRRAVLLSTQRPVLQTSFCSVNELDGVSVPFFFSLFAPEDIQRLPRPSD